MTTYDRRLVAQALATLSPQEIAELREQELERARREQERRDALALTDPVGTVRQYSGFENRAILVRVNEDDLYPRYAEPDDPSTPNWHIFTDYKTEGIEDHQLKRDKLSEPWCVLTPEQLQELGLGE